MTRGSPRERRVELGLGLLSIGRAWGYRNEPPPPESEARRLMQRAVALGIRFFDTAPAYGASERLFGAFLATLGDARRDIVVATKMGEHWDADSGTAFADHSYDALRRSLDRSLALLGRIDLLQIHKASLAALMSDGVRRAIDHARSLGIARFGASVSDLEAARFACDTGLYDALQFPFNSLSPALSPVFGMAAERGLKAIVNRPFAMGRIIGEAPTERHTAMRDALGAVLAQRFEGVILAGTKSPLHLEETSRIFSEAQEAAG